MAAIGKKGINVEWVNVTYRSIGFILLVLLLAAGGGGYWYWSHWLVPKEAARAAIDQATGRLGQVVALNLNEDLAAIAGNAKSHLETAEVQFGGEAYREAKLAANRSEQMSMRVLSRAGDDKQERVVQFKEIEGEVRVKRAGGFSWQSANTRMSLRVGDQVKTSSNGSAVVLYFDGTRTIVAPGSLLEIRDLYEDPVTKVRRVREKLNWGSVQASTQKRNVSGSYHEVATDTVKARVEDSGEFRISYDKADKTSTVDVFGGRVQLKSRDRTALVEAGERMRASADGKLSGKEALPGVPRLLLPSDQRVFVFEDPAQAKVTLNWEELPQADAYRLSISSKPLFTEPLYDATRSDTNAVLAELEPGAYHWRVAALSQNGTAGPFSASRRFRVSNQRVRDRSDNDPPQLSISEFVSIGQMIIINGATDPDAKLWIDNNKVDVFEDGSFNAVVKLRREGLNKLLIVAQDPAGNESSLTREAFVETY